MIELGSTAEQSAMTIMLEADECDENEPEEDHHQHALDRARMLRDMYRKGSCLAQRSQIVGTPDPGLTLRPVPLPL